MDEDAELAAMTAVLHALKDLDAEQQARILSYVNQRLGLERAAVQRPPTGLEPQPEGETASQGNGAFGAASFAELFERTSPKNHAHRALVGGYWFQVGSGQHDFDALSVNKELRHLGHGLPNVTNAFTQLKSMKPALAMQVKKSSKSQQARKRYRLTDAGIKTVEGMLKSGGA